MSPPARGTLQPRLEGYLRRWLGSSPGASPLPFGGSTVLRLTRGPAGIDTTGNLSATQSDAIPTEPRGHLGTPAAHKAPPQTGTLAQRALEEWERTLCENKAVAILAQMQAARPALIQKDGGEMLTAIVLDRPLAEAKALVDDPAAFTREMTRILIAKQSHPLIFFFRPTPSWLLPGRSTCLRACCN